MGWLLPTGQQARVSTQKLLTFPRREKGGNLLPSRGCSSAGCAGALSPWQEAWPRRPCLHVTPVSRHRGRAGLCCPHSRFCSPDWWHQFCWSAAAWALTLPLPCPGLLWFCVRRWEWPGCVQRGSERSECNNLSFSPFSSSCPPSCSPCCHFSCRSARYSELLSNTPCVTLTTACCSGCL